MMRNELLLLASLVLAYGGALIWLRLFGKSGLYGWTILATIAANIEVTLLVNAFGMEQTLGNVLFASTFLATDILSECYGKKAAQKAVYLGVAASFFFILISQSWLLYTPSPNDVMAGPLRTVFSNTPRMMLVSLAVYAVAQHFDVWLYHKWWAFTQRRCGDSRRFLWLRNNGSTLFSQLLNTILFTLGAFWGSYSWGTLLSLMASSYVIFIFTSLADTPAVYLARSIAAGRAGGRAAKRGD